MTDVLKVIDDMVDRFYKEFGDLHKKEWTQHEKHLTWIVSKYAKLAGVSITNDENKPYFGQEYNNFTFKIGYRAGLKEREKAYQQGYEDATEEFQSKLKELVGLNE